MKKTQGTTGQNSLLLWIDKTGREKVAQLLGVEKSAVANWCVGISTPKDVLKIKINKLSKGFVTFEDMAINGRNIK